MRCRWGAGCNATAVVHEVDLLVIIPQSVEAHVSAAELAKWPGATDATSLLGLVVDSVNRAYARSCVPARFRLLAAPPLPVDFSDLCVGCTAASPENWHGELINALMNPTSTQGNAQTLLAAVGAERDTVGADIVLLWRKFGDNGPAASGAPMQDLGLKQANGQLTWRAMLDSGTVAHELGQSDNSDTVTLPTENPLEDTDWLLLCISFVPYKGMRRTGMHFQDASP